MSTAVVSAAELGLDPGKSMRPQENVEALAFDHNGMFGDREYMWVEAAEHENVNYRAAGEIAVPGQFLSQREDPETLTSIQPELVEAGVRLRWKEEESGLVVPRAEDIEENRRDVSVWSWNGKGVDQGEEAAEWGSDHIGRPVRLVAVSDVAPRYVEGDPALGRVGFADGHPLLVIRRDSVEAVNEYLESKGKPTIPAERFRANIILEGEGQPFDEDRYEQLTLSANGLVLALDRRKACGRCPVPDTDQVTGERKTHVRSALGKLGRSGFHADTERYGDKKEIFFGQNYTIRMPEGMEPGEVIELVQGAELEATVSDDTNWRPVAA